MESNAHAKREPIVALLTTLHSKFAANLDVLDRDVIALLEIIDLNSRRWMRFSVHIGHVPLKAPPLRSRFG